MIHNQRGVRSPNNGKFQRKIIQIATAQGELTVLCNDGSVWIYDFEGYWVKCEDIPQGSEKNYE